MAAAPTGPLLGRRPLAWVDMPLSREKLNDLHELGRLLESLSTSAYSSYLVGQAQASEEIVRTVEDLIEDTEGVVTELLAPPP